MATATESRVVYGAGLAQGIVLVTFPAASTIFTASDEYDLSNTQYGTLFLPQVITAIAAALLGAGLAGRFGTKRVYLAGLVAGLVSMTLLLVSATVSDNQSVAYPLLLVATAFLGVGFGLTVPAFNTFAAAFHSEDVNRAILVLNALLGLGTVLAPVFVAIFVGLGFWWGLPLTSTCLLVALDRREPRPAPACRAGAHHESGRVQRAVAVLDVRGVRRPLRHLRDGERQLVAARHDERGRRVHDSGRARAHGVLGHGDRRPRSACRRAALGPGTARVPRAAARAGRRVPAGRGAPGRHAGARHRGVRPRRPRLLRAAAAHDQLRPGGADRDLGSVAGGVIAFYQAGYGIAAFGVGPLLDNGVELTTIFDVAAVVALVLAGASFVVARRRPSPAALHPQLGAGVK